MRLIFILVGLALAMTTNALADSNKEAVDAELFELLNIMEGDWDNNWFMLEQEEKNAPETHRRRHHHTIYRRMDLPNLGPHVIFAQKWRDRDPDSIYVVNAYVFTPDYQLGAVHLEIFKPTNILDFRDAHLEPEVYEELKKLTAEDYERMPYNCSSYLRKNDKGVFVGSFIEPCLLGQLSDGRDSYADTDLRASKNQFWVLSSSRDANYYDAFGNIGHVPRAEIKVRWYKCQVNVANREIPEPPVRFGGPDNGIDGVIRFRNINVHDQGDSISLSVPTQVPEPYRLQLTNHRNPDDVFSDAAMRLELFEGDAAIPVAAGIASPDADWIGFESGDYFSLCKRKPGDDWYTSHSPLDRIIDK